MLDIRKSLSNLVVRNMLGQATPSEVAQLEEWASLSVENRNWLRRFNDYEYILSRIEFCNSIDLDGCKEEFNRRLDAQMKKKSKVVQMWRWLIHHVQARISQ